MVKNYTHLNDNSVKAETGNEHITGNTHNKERDAAPSDSIIRNLLNYSKALSVLSDKTTGNVHVILLN